MCADNFKLFLAAALWKRFNIKFLLVSLESCTDLTHANDNKWDVRLIAWEEGVERLLL
jgi:hypothetical protein